MSDISPLERDTALSILITMLQAAPWIPSRHLRGNSFIRTNLFPCLALAFAKLANEWVDRDGNFVPVLDLGDVVYDIIAPRSAEMKPGYLNRWTDREAWQESAGGYFLRPVERRVY